MNIDRLVCGTFLSSLAWLAMSRGVTEHKTDDGTITAELHFCSSIITEELTMGSMTGAMTGSMIDLDIELTIGVVGTSGSKSWFTGVTGEYTGEVGEVGMSEDDGFLFLLVTGITKVLHNYQQTIITINPKSKSHTKDP